MKDQVTNKSSIVDANRLVMVFDYEYSNKARMEAYEIIIEASSVPFSASHLYRKDRPRSLALIVNSVETLQLPHDARCFALSFLRCSLGDRTAERLPNTVVRQSLRILATTALKIDKMVLDLHGKISQRGRYHGVWEPKVIRRKPSNLSSSPGRPRRDLEISGVPFLGGDANPFRMRVDRGGSYERLVVIDPCVRAWWKVEVRLGSVCVDAGRIDPSIVGGSISLRIV